MEFLRITGEFGGFDAIPGDSSWMWLSHGGAFCGKAPHLEGVKEPKMLPVVKQSLLSWRSCSNLQLLCAQSL